MSANGGSSYARAWTIARTDLRQLRQARDFWMPLVIIASMFFVVIPGILLLLVTRVSNFELATQLSDVVGALPTAIQEHVKGDSGPVQASYALAVYLFAPLAI